jgi:hypothetical protein
MTDLADQAYIHALEAFETATMKAYWEFMGPGPNAADQRLARRIRQAQDTLEAFRETT